MMTITNLTFRLSSRFDFPQLVELENLVWNTNTAPAEIYWHSTEEYAQHCPEGSQLLALSGDRICGYFSYRIPTPLDSNKHVAELALAIHPDFQGQGVAQELMKAGEDWMKRLGKKKLSLRVMATNPKAIRFYEKYGFIKQGLLVNEFYIDGKYVDDIMMYKMLDD
ncbi:GNAT family N-acetyltransferase [Fictibacillus sp. KU28468]|uniref:GNAT family N-acetyltransferase n=1 Tax=Fictibacillus sp. KU28468 TaxID=2991053 RepID=UPI00223E364F|nr:GNAT family N-acetyltransferase [Fictibacillus sp. KU28468]UZJ78640.1 GNAT family N-acetyltransferase [Fictibacillus sp. KU28468]